ncbi:hypothetical protein ACOMHN_039925 [Nucella lapillus]
MMAEQRKESRVSHEVNLEDDNIRETTRSQSDDPACIRDPKHLNTHLKLMFDDIFAEPHSSVHSFDSVWSTSDKVFQGTRTTCYRLLSLLCAVPAAVHWGLCLACLTCCSVWCHRPCIRIFEVSMHCVRDCFSPCALCLRLFTEALGACFSNLRLTVLHRKAEQPGFSI